MTLRTLTFDPAIYKLVPVEKTHEMTVAAYAADRTLVDVYNALLAAVPDTLPGVVEHSGKPMAWIDEVGQLVVLEKFIKQHIGYVSEGRAIPDAWQPLFTHPAPAQPVERQELSDGLLCAEWMKVSCFIKDHCSIQQVLQYARAIIAADRGQA